MSRARLGTVLAVAVFLALLALGYFLRADYGVSWDDPAQSHMGVMTDRYVKRLSPEAVEHPFFRYYGPLLEYATFRLNESLGNVTQRDRFLLRHLVSHGLFLAGGLAFFFLLRSFTDWPAALLGALTLCLVPALYAHSFFNSKDVPFLAAVVVFLAVLRSTELRPSLVRFFVTGLAVGLAGHLRIVGLMLGVPVGVAWWHVVSRDRTTGVRRAAFAAAFAVGCGLALYSVWPFLWQAPLAHLASVVRTASRFPWSGEMRFMGRTLASEAIPWYYIPWYVLITLPMPLTALALAGFVAFVARCCRRGLRLSDDVTRWGFYFLFIPLVPWAASVAARSVLYDQWRHFFFAAPSVVAAAVFAWTRLRRALARRRPWLLHAAAGSILAAFVQMVGVDWSTHPFQHAWFNALVHSPTEPLSRRYAVDYWGVSYLPALRFIADHADTVVTVAYAEDPAEFNVEMLSAAQRERIRLTKDVDAADYYVTTFRRDPDETPRGEMVYRAIVSDSIVVAAYRLAHPLSAALGSE